MHFSFIFGILIAYINYPKIERLIIMERSSGVLLHISSLPGKYGIGSFGAEALEFAKFLKNMGCSYWQVLPLCTTDSCNSPYKSFSAFAGNPYFIDLPTLQKRGLLTDNELKENEYSDIYSVPFGDLNEKRLNTLKKAFERIDQTEIEKISQFSDDQKHWLPDFALYMALKNDHANRDWYTWEEPLKFREPLAMKEATVKYSNEILFYKFVQYEFYSQWQDLKLKINSLGIKIIGDMPIYVSLESSDVWSNLNLFDLDDTGMPKNVAGVPPDYFCADGQKWGNPLYRWDVLKEKGYAWWLLRIENALSIYDMVRIDHFRAFSAFWAVPFEEKTAKTGKWQKGPGIDFFDAVFKKFKNPKIIAEDLGDIDNDVRELLEKTKLPGMRVLQFAFISDNDNSHMPHNYNKNVIAYTGTHDNSTILGWMWEATESQRKSALAYCNFTEPDWSQGGVDSPICRACVRTVWASVAPLAIVPIQDLCGFGNDTKMNKPGVADGNWAFRITPDALNRIDQDWLKKINRIYKRSGIN
ncbi:MAG: 4-alpha-glucanotransferase [Oscillospiraceae bacterium]